MLEIEPQSTAALIYVNRRTSTIMFLEELEDLKNRFPERFQLVHVLGQEMTDVEMLSGRLDVERLGRILDTIVPVDDVDEWFLCGPLAMTDSVRGVLLERDVDPAHVHRELFHVGAPITRRRPAADPGTPVTGSAVTVILDGRSLTLTLPRDGDSILDETLRARSDAPYACKNAVCGTCRAKVDRRNGGDGLELRTRTRRDRPRLRPDLPVPPGDRHGHRGLRPVTAAGPKSFRATNEPQPIRSPPAAKESRRDHARRKLCRWPLAWLRRDDAPNCSTRPLRNRWP